MKQIKETVQVTRDLDWRIADLVHFAREVRYASELQYEDDEWMIAKAKAYWDRQHGED